MDQLTEDQRSEFNTCFQQFDKDNDGRLGPKEAVMALKALGVNVPESEVGAGVDVNGFLGVVVRKLQITDPEDELKRAFNCFDTEGNGHISCAHLKQILMQLGDVLNHQEADDLIREIDTDHDGYVTSNDATKLILSKLA
ncbi:calcium-binding protein [Cavenderia fasciculata]|uniref:Calcium-binding protein n=1 Tax=Cavenderia fasciculata TaxID=261658 RepID=F4Q0P5_CACFS|nr:calcium-binding protein [Cavenderia fasciculata]EGG18396.1 calcium-binding protein [Cavenderia fasciculata]|eukprot:XP_004366300.1 calcium-binding protein [Cavenderia fasciculata]